MSGNVSIPLRTELIPNGIRAGTVIVVEFDPECGWLAVATTIAARVLQANGHVSYLAMLRPLENVKYDLARLGVDTPALEKDHRLIVEDWYSATLSGGRLGTFSGEARVFEPIQGGVRARSLKVGDLSVEWLRDAKEGRSSTVPPPNALTVWESVSELLRFNEEKPIAEWVMSRVNPEQRTLKHINLQGWIGGFTANGSTNAWKPPAME